MMRPFQEGTKQQGPQSASTTAQRYRKALPPSMQRVAISLAVKPLQIYPTRRRMTDWKSARSSLKGSTAKSSTARILTDTRNGFLADPIYGGNRDLAAWKMIGFPGTHYDYRDWMDHHNERVTLPVIGISNHPN